MGSNDTIYLLENDEAYRDEFCNAAEARGLTVKTHDLRKENPKDAAIEARQEGYALALVDRRAKYDEDPGDDSGLTFIKNLHKRGRGTFSVLVSARPMGIEIFDMFRNEELGGVVDKSEVRVHVLLSCVNHFLRFGAFPNGIARIVCTSQGANHV